MGCCCCCPPKSDNSEIEDEIERRKEAIKGVFDEAIKVLILGE